MKYNIDPQIRKFCMSVPFVPPLIAASHAPMKLMLKFVPTKGIVTERVKVGGCPIDIYSLGGLPENAPCVVFYHGGGFGFGAAPHHKSLAEKLAKEVNCRVICPDYRLLPSHVYPEAREDAIKTYRYVCGRFPESKMAVVGDSAGGVLAVCAVHDAEKEDLKLPVLQMLLYPVIDAECQTDSMAKFTDTPLWNSVNNKAMWKMYLKNASVTEASPMQMKLPEHIPETYIETAEFDCLHDEGVAYAERLKTAGASVELYQTERTPHGYDIAGKSGVMKECMNRRVNELRRAFAEETAKI